MLESGNSSSKMHGRNAVIGGMNLKTSLKLLSLAEFGTFQIETFQLQKKLSIFGQFFPTLLDSFQFQSVLTNFVRFFPTSAKLSYLRLSNLKLSNFRLSNSKFSNFSFFPTALSKYTYPVTYLDEAFDGKLLQYVTFFISFKIFK